MVIDEDRRQMFVDLYRLAEYYEKPPFQPGDVEGNAQWFVTASENVLKPFLMKHNNRMAADLAFAISDEANRMAVTYNKAPSIL